MASVGTPVQAPNWRLAFVLAAAGHLVLGTALAMQRGEVVERIPEPVMVIELSEGVPTAPSPDPSVTEQLPAEAQRLPDMVVPRLAVPEVRTPMSSEPVAVPTRRPVPPTVQPRVPPLTLSPRSVPAPAPAPAPPAPSTATGNAGDGSASDPRVREQQADWISLINSHLARRYRYPREARRAGQSGTPTVRFTVDRRGRVSNISIAQSSGHAVLDEATIDLVRRTAPFPAMPRSLQRDSMTLSLPIEYELDRD